MKGKHLFSINNSHLSYEVVEWRPNDSIVMFQDPDTEKTFCWFPGSDLKTTQAIWRQFGFELGDPNEMPEID